MRPVDLLVLCLLMGVVSLVSAEPVVQPFTGYYTGKILPTPQEVTYTEDLWPVVDCKTKTASACLLLSAKASEAEKLAAAEIAARVSYLSGGVTVPIAVENQRPKAEVYLGLGVVETSQFLQRHLRMCRVEPVTQAEGYSISFYEHHRGLRGVFLAGHDEAGAYFAAQSLVQLLERVGDKVVLHGAQVRDWPTYRLRSFKTGGDCKPESGSRQMGLWAPFAKFNCYNICYSTLGQDKWVDPSPEYREHVRILTEHLRSRGLDCMPFVNPYYLWKEHIEVSEEGDLQKLFEACKIGLDAGGKRVMLCLDDFASEGDSTGPKLYHVRSEKDRARWGDDLAAVNVAMINDLWGRLHKAYPDCQLYVVLPYYWDPSGHYREGGEEYLKEASAGIAPEVRIVWTGPRVRSAQITAADVDHYQGLLNGRRAMLWDNTIYMHHTPPHYFLDTFHTRYADKFWELTSGEVHLNAGSGEIYKCGLLAAADYLWNPAAYDPEASLRTAIAMIAGPDQVDRLLAFRDAFYKVYDELAPQLGGPSSFLATAKKMTSQPFDGAEMESLSSTLNAEVTLCDEVAATCQNAGVVAEARQRVAGHQAYRDALTALKGLPPMTEEDAANLIANPGAEQVVDGKPVGWQTYTGAGGCALVSEEGRKGGRCGKLVANKMYEWGDGRTSINVALMLTGSDGFTGANALQVQPMHRYYYSFWLKGTAPRVVISFVTWSDPKSSASRGSGIGKTDAFSAPGEWKFFYGSFVVPAGAARGALKIGFDGYAEQGGGLGELCVDDVYLGRSRARALQGADTE